MATKIESGHLEAWRLFLTAHSEVIDALAGELQDERGLPLTWYEVLLYLSRAEGERLRMHELADSLLLSRSALTRLVDRVERAGYVERVTCESDRRGLFVQLTAAGREAYTAAAPVHLRGIEEHFTSKLTASEARTIAKAMSKIVEAHRQ